MENWKATKQIYLCAMFRFACIGLVLTCTACSTLGGKARFARHLERDIRRSEVFSKAFTGFALLDPAKGKTLCAVNANQYFTPASNTKILTLYASLRVLGDSLPALHVQTRGDSVHVQPTGDPSFLHPDFKDWQKTAAFLKEVPGQTLVMHEPPGQPLPFGPGWSWDDFDEAYSPERSAWPIYGNVRRVFAPKPDSLAIEPDFWTPFLQKKTDILGGISASDPENRVFYSSKSTFKPNFERWVPIHGVQSKLAILLEDTLKRKIVVDPHSLRGQRKTLYACPADTVYRRLMYESDNFIAEQLLLLCAGVKFDTLDAAKTIQWMQNNEFSGLDLKPKWVDGSGLSRYNLNTPNTLVRILLQLWQEQPKERLFDLFPAGGLSGTISDWYKNTNAPPYVFAKTGSMSGVHCLSGYLVAKSGKVLIFSFMHNNFTGSSKPYKAEMQRFLSKVKDHY